MRDAPQGLLLVVALSMSFAEAGAAQAITTATLYGVVTGLDSAGIEEAVITVTNTSNGGRWRTVTRAHGRYVLEYLSLGGSYTLQVRAIGYSPLARSGIVLSLGERRRADFRLTPVLVDLPELTVTATADPVLNAGRTGPAQTVTSELALALPVLNRDFSQLTFLSPQAVKTIDQGTSFAGQSDRLNGLQIDGTANSDLSGTSGLFGFGTAGGATVRTLSVEAVDELQIQIAPFDVRYGGFAGGLVNAVTRSGSNRWGGSISTYFQDETLTGKDPAGNRASEFSTGEVTLTLGGPIVRDRAAFFLDLGLQRNRGGLGPSIGTDTTGGADSVGIGIRRSSAERFQEILQNTWGVDPGSIAPSQFQVPAGNGFAKLTLWPALNHRIEVSQNYAHGTTELPSGYQGLYYGLSSQDVNKPTTVAGTRINWTVAGGGALSNELTLGRLAIRETCDPAADYPEVRAAADASELRAGIPVRDCSNFADQDVLELTDNLSRLLGTHHVTLGTHEELINLKGVHSFPISPLWRFGSLDSLEIGHANLYVRDIPLRSGGPSSDFQVNQLGFYLQDQWTPGPRLTLTGGVRFDVPFLPDQPAKNAGLDSALGINTATTPSGNLLWSPRLGFNYDLNGRGSGFLRGGVGLFSGRPVYLYFSNTYESTGLEVTTLVCRGPANTPPFTPDLGNQPTSCPSGPGAVPDVAAFDPSFRFPRNLRLSLGADVALPWASVATVDLLYIQGVDQFDVIDVNLAEPTATASGEGGRVLYGSIDPAAGLIPNRLSDAFGRVAQMRNGSGDRSISATVQLLKRMPHGQINLAYTYTDARSRINSVCLDLSCNLDTPLDGTLRNRELARSDFESTHKITAAGVVALPLKFQLGLSYNGYSGRPDTYVISGDANGDGSDVNDIVYVPTDASDITLADPSQWTQLSKTIKNEACLSKRRGHLMRRNSCQAPWVTQLNARLTKIFPTARGQSLEITADIFNLLNLLDSDWGVQRRLDYGISTPLLGLVGYDQAKGRGIYEVLPVTGAKRDDEATRWRMQLGARYTF